MAGKKKNDKNNQENPGQLEAVATYEQDSKRFHRYRLESEEAGQVVGTLYIAKSSSRPERFNVTLTPATD